MRALPLGHILVGASPTAGVTSYRFYFADNADVFSDPNGSFYEEVPYFEVDAVEGQAEYDVDLNSVSPLGTPGTYYIAAVAASFDEQSGGSALSDPSNVVSVVRVDVPLPPTNLRYVAAGGSVE